MAKKSKAKLGRTFDSIIDDDNGISHKDIFNRFVSPDNQEETIPDKTGSSTKEFDTDSQKEEDRRAVSDFIWYAMEGDSAKSGLGRACELWDDGMTIETTTNLSFNSLIKIETLPGLTVKSLTANIVTCFETDEGVYVSELRFV